jgi:AsmA-like protein
VAFGVVMALLVAGYVRAIVSPVRLPLLGNLVREAATENVQDGYALELGDITFGLENGFKPMIQAAPVKVTEAASGAVIDLGSVELVISPLKLFLGKVEVSLVLERPHMQVVQDFLGVRLAALEFAVADGGETTVRVAESALPENEVVIGDAGIDFGDAETEGLASDNEWIIRAVNSMEESIAGLAARFKLGELRSVEIRQADVEMIDRVYRTYRRFDLVDLFMVPDGDGVLIDVTTTIANRQTRGVVIWRPVEGGTTITGDMRNIDLAVVVPILDEEEAYVSIKGASEFSFTLEFAEGKGIQRGEFIADPTGTVLQIRTDTFPILAEPFIVKWVPSEALLELPPTRIQIENSTTYVEGRAVMGVDDNFGPTVGFLVRARDTTLQPFDVKTAGQPIELIEVQGWAASIYGAMGIDKFRVEAGEMKIEGDGRFDFLQKGIGIDFNLAMQSASMDQLKRFWPYYIGSDIRRGLVSSIVSGTISDAIMRIDLEPGVLDNQGFAGKVPEGGIFIDVRAQDIKLAAFEGVPAFELDGQALLRVEDSVTTVKLDRGVIRQERGDIILSDIALLNNDFTLPEQVVELSGDLSGELPSLVALADSDIAKGVEGFDLSFNADDLTGQADITIIATVRLDGGGEVLGADYTANGRITGFSSNVPIEGRVIENGELTFTASQEGYLVNGRAELDGVVTEMALQSSGGDDPMFTASAVLDAKARKAMGLDFEQFIGGSIRYVARPQPDGDLQIAADLTDASLTIKDLGVGKKVGEPGRFSALVRQEGDITKITKIIFGYGQVKIAGELTLGEGGTVIAADFSEFALNEGDTLKVSLKQIEGGFRVEVDGDQIDFKPFFDRFLSLGEGGTGPQSTENASDQVLEFNIDLKRALGAFKTTAFNVHLAGRLDGSDLSNLEMQAQLGNDRSISVISNETGTGNTMTLASNDVGTLLRFVGIYPRLLGGDGSLVIASDKATKTNSGEFVMRDFSIVEEAAVETIVGNHQASREFVAASSRLDFDRGRAVFLQEGDKVTIKEAALEGRRMGGTARGTIYTADRRYDLVGTYVPLFGLNNAFQQLPILGRLIGGREGEGLIGITFKIEGPLDDPQFVVNPASVLAPGVLRRLFEFRANNETAKPN